MRETLAVNGFTYTQANIYLFKVNNRNTKGVEYVQS